MGNCLVTKLKESVQNDNLKKLGCIRFKKHESGDFILTLIGNGQPYTVKCSDDRSFIDNSVSVTSATIRNTNTHQFTFTNSGYNIEIYGKYNIVNAGGSGTAYMMDISDINSCADMTSFALNSPSFANGSLDALSTLNSLTALQLQVPGGLTGNIKSLSDFTNLANLTLSDNTNLTGDWCELVRAQYAKGRTEGSIGIQWIGSLSNVKFNNAAIANTGKGTLTWSSATGKITLTVVGTTDPYEADL